MSTEAWYQQLTAANGFSLFPVFDIIMVRER
jgi:hypothetical protein